MPKTPNRTIRIPTPLWEAAKTLASKLDMTMSQVVRDALLLWIREVMRGRH